MKRRDFLRLTAVVAAGPAVACGNDRGGSSGGGDRAAFPQSVASGDPRPDAVVLWTRAVDPDRPGQDVTVSLEVSPDQGFGRIVARAEGMTARAAHDHVVKVKVTGLEPRTRYHYRFRMVRGDRPVFSPVGRTRTAPRPDQAVKVRLAIASCQDYNGRYYNSWQQLVDRDEDLDLVLFVGDYVYETARAAPDGARRVVFSDPDGAMGSGAERIARSVSNYRDLYRTVRSDPILQQVHERYPFVVIWDDHEFSNDCWGDHATYTSGAQDEQQRDRRRYAEQAFFEYTPIDLPEPAPSGAFDLDATPVFPDARIYRELIFGAYLRLVLTDYRSYRPDHLIPENAYPGTVFLTAADVDQQIAAGRLPATLPALIATDTFAAIDIDAPGRESLKNELLAAAIDEATRAGISPAESTALATTVVRGTLALAHVNAVLTARNKADLVPPPATNLPHGLAFVHLGKRAWYSSIGARYVVAKDMFDVYAAVRFAATAGASERALGQAQEDWLTAVLATPRERGWTVVASSVSMSALVLDLRNKPVPPESQARILFSADQWDGFPGKKAELLARMKASSGGRTMVVAGDIHASYASIEGGVPCLTAPAVSSTAASEVARAAVAGVGLDPTSPAIGLLVASLDSLFKEGNPNLVLSDTHHHGVVVLEVDAESALATYLLIPAAEVTTSYAGRAAELSKRTKVLGFRVEPGKITPVG